MAEECDGTKALVHYACHIRQKKNCYCDTRDFPNFHCMSNCRQNRKKETERRVVVSKKTGTFFVVLLLLLYCMQAFTKLRSSTTHILPWRSNFLAPECFLHGVCDKKTKLSTENFSLWHYCKLWLQKSTVKYTRLYFGAILFGCSHLQKNPVSFQF